MQHPDTHNRAAATLQQVDELGVLLIPRARSRVIQAIAWVLDIFGQGEAFRTKFWTTYRLPFGRPTIAYPPNIVLPPRDNWEVLEHELIHVKQFAPPWGPLWMALLAILLPLPAIFSGRWYIERPAYLLDILAGRRTIDDAVWTLWLGYGRPWPRSLMRRWFERQLAAAGRNNQE